MDGDPVATLDRGRPGSRQRVMIHLRSCSAPRGVGRLLLAGLCLGISFGSDSRPVAAQDAEGLDETVVIYLVRHAERADDGTRDPPLSEGG